MFRSPPRGRGRMRLAAATVALAAMLAPATASALNPADVPDVNVDTGRFTIPISCAITLPDFGNVKIIDLPTEVDIQGGVAAQLGPGQEFWLTQGKGSITFPGWLSALAGLIGVNRADAYITSLNIGAENASPDNVDLAKSYDLTAKNITLSPGQPFTVGLPASGTFDVGPYRAPGDGSITLRFNSALADVDLVSSAGFTLKVRANCTPVGGNALLSVAVGGAPNQPPSKPQNQPYAYKAVPTGSLIGIINAPYSCQLGGGTVGVGIAVGGILPLSIQRSGAMTINEGSGALTIPATVVDQLRSIGITSISGTVTKLNIDTPGGVPASQNVAGPFGIAIPETPLVAGQKIVLGLPTTGSVSVTPIRPAEGSNKIYVQLGEAAATFRLNGGAASIPAVCAAPSPTVYLAEAPVLDPAPAT